MKKNFSRGFTLIELLVVIAIIGILSSVVLVSLNGARGKANATALRSTMASLRSAVAICNASSNPGTWATTDGMPVCANETAVVPAEPWGGATVAAGAIAVQGSTGAQYLNITVAGHSITACNTTWHVDEASTTLGAAFATPDTAGCK